MAAFYPYLIASLPMLHFGMRPPFTFEQFLQVCRNLVPGKDYQVLCTLPGPEQYTAGSWPHPFIRQWVEFDTALRNEMATLRSGKQHSDRGGGLRPDTYTGPPLAGVISAADLSPSLLEGERVMDEARWRKLDELEAPHHFDLEVLISYAYKLCILIRWDRVRGADRARILDEVVSLPEGG